MSQMASPCSNMQPAKLRFSIGFKEATRRTAMQRMGGGCLFPVLQGRWPWPDPQGLGRAGRPKPPCAERKGPLQERSERQKQRLRRCGCSPTGPCCGIRQDPCGSTGTAHPGAGSATLRLCPLPGRAAGSSRIQHRLKAFTGLSASQSWSFIQTVY